MNKRVIGALMIFMLLFSLMTGCVQKVPVITDQNIASNETTQDQDQQTKEGEKEKEEAREKDVAKEETKDKKSESKENNQQNESQQKKQPKVQKDGQYTSKEEVAAYIHEYGELPSNYITKKQASDLGWQSKEGNLWEVAPGKSIGGDRFGNREKNLPDKKGRKWTECDIDYEGGYRQEKRIVFSNDGLVYFTADHYRSFEELYGH